MDWYKFILKIKPDGKVFRSILYTKIFYEVLGDAFQTVIDYATTTINDQVWFVNDDFDPEPWERRYNVTIPTNSTLSQRREYIKSCMMFPQSQNRLSKSYFEDVLIDSGFTGLTLSYNSTGATDGILHVNDFSDETLTFSIGSLTYNSFIVTGNIYSDYYDQVILLLMSLKPLQVALYSDLDINVAIALSDSLTIALSDSLAIALTL